MLFWDHWKILGRTNIFLIALPLKQFFGNQKGTSPHTMHERMNGDNYFEMLWYRQRKWFEWIKLFFVGSAVLRSAVPHEWNPLSSRKLISSIITGNLANFSVSLIACMNRRTQVRLCRENLCLKFLNKADGFTVITIYTRPTKQRSLDKNVLLVDVNHLHLFVEKRREN